MKNDISAQMQKLIDSYARFTDSHTKKLLVETTDGNTKHCTVVLTIGFRHKPDVVISFSDVKKMHVEQIQNFGIYELEFKKEGEYYLFDFVGTASDWGDLWFLAKGIEVVEKEFKQ